MGCGAIALAINSDPTLSRAARAFKKMLEDETTKRLMGKYEALLPEIPSDSE